VESGKRPGPRPAAHALHYTVETTIRKNEEIAGTTTIRFQPLGDDLRVLPIHLLGTLRLKEVSFSHGDAGDWAPAAFVQEAEKEDADAAVVFPSSQPRDVLQLRLTYEGKGVILEAGRDVFFVSARTSWYPNLGTFTDLAAFDLTYRLPKRFKVVSVGRLLEERVEGDNKISIWRQERPIRVAGFNYGKLRHLERPDPESGMTLDIYASDALGLGDPEVLEDAAMADGFNTARVGTFYFGPLPEKRVSITQQTQFSFGQSWPSLIYLPSSVARGTPNRRSVLTRDSADFVDRVGSHEFAHQWWGHLVGWAGYRDQWLSEGFAEFTSALVVERAGGRKGFDDFWEHMRTRVLEKPTRALIASDEAGPIIQGFRLSTWQNEYAAQAMIYTKAAYVLHMLRAMMRDLKNPSPDANFIAIMKDFVKSYAGKNPSTRDFQTVVERHMVPDMNGGGDGKMDWFFRQWVYGTEIPRYREKLEVAKTGDGQYRITGTVAQEGVSADFRALTHLYLDYGKGEIAHLGLLPIIGSSTRPVDVTVKLAKAPKRAFLNANHDVLSRD
jgi:aminopeptidase N